MKRKALFCWLTAAVMLWMSGCSHLHVDLNSSWRIAADAQVVVEVEEPPAEVDVVQIVTQVRQLGWKTVESAPASDARLLCRWQRVVDLTEDSELTSKITSFHAKLMAADDGRVLGVADYFYGTGEMELWPGVEQALTSLYQRVVVPPSPVAEPAMVTSPGVDPVAAGTPAAAPEQEQEQEQEQEPVTEPRQATASTEVIVPVVDKGVPAASMASAVAKPSPAPSVVMQQQAPVDDRPATPASVEPPLAVEPGDAIVPIPERPSAIQQVAPEGQEPQPVSEPEQMEVSPWVPRFQGLGLENWGQDEINED